MKHTFKVTNLLIIIFVFAQLMGLLIINEYVDIKESSVSGEAVIKDDVYKHSVGGAPPEIENKYVTAIFILFSILFGTGVLLIIIKYRLGKVMKVWFFLAIVFCLGKAFSPFTYKLINYTLPSTVKYSVTIAMIIAAIFAYLKLFKNNIIIHNLTEIFLYGGLAAFIVPNLDIQVAAILLVGISFYDMYAVWKSKHMVKMAQFQSNQKMFAGLMIPYKKPKDSKHQEEVQLFTQKVESSKNQKEEHTSTHHKNKKTKHEVESSEEEIKTAILGGGDIAFPLIFSGVVLFVTGSFINSFIITITTTIALALLLIKGQQNKFYPAMPFISAGCFAGYAIVWLLPKIGF
jgi:presenilin-like A22 family membrane protease